MLCQVRITARFRRDLSDIEAYLRQAGAAPIFDTLFLDLVDTVISSLEQFPDMGRDFMAHEAGSVEVLQGVAGLRAIGGFDSLRAYILPPYLLLYATAGQTVYLLSIRHHRQLSFDFTGLWGV